MMGRSHAISGAVGWLGLCTAATTLTDMHPSWLQIAAGGVAAAGAALLPDIDHPDSTITRSLGPVTRIVSRVVSWISDKVRDGTCRCCDTPGTRGHRTLTHTALFAAVAGVGVSVAAWRAGAPASATVVGFATLWAVLGVGGLLKLTNRWLTGVFAAAAAGAAVWHLGDGLGWWWLGVPFAFGAFAHSVGDGLTEGGVPLWWPARIRGCRWRRVGLPKLLRFRTGGGVEWVVTAVMLAGGVGCLWLLAT